MIVISGLMYFCTKCGETLHLSVKVPVGQTYAVGSCLKCNSTQLESRIA